jgi:hypothetical protein
MCGEWKSPTSSKIRSLFSRSAGRNPGEAPRIRLQATFEFRSFSRAAYEAPSSVKSKVLRHVPGVYCSASARVN